MGKCTTQRQWLTFIASPDWSFGTICLQLLYVQTGQWVVLLCVSGDSEVLTQLMSHVADQFNKYVYSSLSYMLIYITCSRTCTYMHTVNTAYLHTLSLFTSVGSDFYQFYNITVNTRYRPSNRISNDLRILFNITRSFL